jgi:hypothetical protein
MVENQQDTSLKGIINIEMSTVNSNNNKQELWYLTFKNLNLA